MERCTVGRNNGKPLWRVCGKWSMIRVVAVKLIKQKQNEYDEYLCDTIDCCGEKGNKT